MSKQWFGWMAVLAAGVMTVQAEEGKPERPPRGQGGPGGEGGGFSRIDQNGDGKVTVEEMTAMMTERVKMRFTRIDKDADGKLTEAEFNAGRPPSPPEGSAGPAREMPKFADVDANKDGSITLEEMTASAAVKMKEHVKEMDKNGDGVIGEDERPARGAGGQHGGGPRREGPPAAP